MHSRTAQVVSTSCAALALVSALLGAGSANAEAPCEKAPRACQVAMHSDTARGLALATGQRASAVSTSALAYNPATLVLGKLYHIEGSVDYMTAWDTVALGAAVVDSSTSKIGAGIAFRGLLSGKTGIGGIDARAGIAFPLADSISAGVGLRYLNLQHEEQVAGGVSRSVGLVAGFTMDAAIRIQPSPMFQLSALAVNFLDRDSELVPVQLGGAAALSIGGIANVGADLLCDITTFGDTTGVNFGFSAEFFIAQIVPLRLGYGYDVQRELHILTGGAGYTDRSVGFDLSIQQELSRGNDTRVMGAFRYYVQ